MFLQATFKLEPYCVMLALRRQNQQRHHSHYLYILLVSNISRAVTDRRKSLTVPLLVLLLSRMV